MEVVPPRSGRREQRQVLLLGLAALLALLGAGLSGALRVQAVRDDVHRARVSLQEPIAALHDVHHAQIAILGEYLRFDGGRGGSAALGSRIQALLAAWETYEQASAGLPGEAKAVAPARGTVEYLEATFLRAVRSDASSLEELDPQLTDPAIADLSDGLNGAVRDAARLYQRASADAAAEAERAAERARVEAVLVSIVAVLALGAAFTAFARASRRRERATARLEVERLRDSCRTDFEARLQRAFDMVQREEDACRVVGDATGQVLPDRKVELLLADSSRAHVRLAAASAPDGCASTGCPVGSPMECAAAVRGQTQEFSSSAAIDACPHLKGRPEGEVGATCVPVSIAGKTIGVLHAVGPAGGGIDDEALIRLELVARKAGDRIGMIRAFARSESQARTDPLTGLVNRRSLEDEVRRLGEDGIPYVVAFADLDRFKQLNDVYGHEMGDRALRLFARVLRDNVRPVDVPARYGGEEFVVVLPDCSVEEARAVLDRVRTRLADAVHHADTPSFTFSAGVAASDPDVPFAATVERADGALLAAKAAGRDRTVAAGPTSYADLPG